MEFSENGKKILIFIFVIAVLAIALGIFLFERKEEKTAEDGPPQFEKHVDDFVIEGDTIRNEKEGLTVKIPEGWTAEKEEQVFENVWGISIFSPNSDIQEYKAPDLYFLNKGCVISINIKESEDSYESIKSIIEDGEATIVKINDKPALKDGGELGGTIIRLAMPKNNKIVYFSLNSTESDKDFCEEEINKFLGEVEI